MSYAINKDFSTCKNHACNILDSQSQGCLTHAAALLSCLDNKTVNIVWKISHVFYAAFLAFS